MSGVTELVVTLAIAAFVAILAAPLLVVDMVVRFAIPPDRPR